MTPEDCHPKDEIFSWLEDDPPNGSGLELHFNATKLYAWCCEQEKLLPPNGEHPDFQLIEAEISLDHVQHIVQRKNVDISYCARLTLERLEEPVLSVLMSDGTTLLIDGNHRLVARAARGFETYRLYRVFVPRWFDFLVDAKMENIRKHLGVSA